MQNTCENTHTVQLECHIQIREPPPPPSYFVVPEGRNWTFCKSGNVSAEYVEMKEVAEPDLGLGGGDRRPMFPGRTPFRGVETGLFLGLSGESSTVFCLPFRVKVRYTVEPGRVVRSSTFHMDMFSTVVPHCCITSFTLIPANSAGESGCTSVTISPCGGPG
eukprot:RCo054941